MISLLLRVDEGDVTRGFIVNKDLGLRQVMIEMNSKIASMMLFGIYRQIIQKWVALWMLVEVC